MAKNRLTTNVLAICSITRIHSQDTFFRQNTLNETFPEREICLNDNNVLYVDIQHIWDTFQANIILEVNKWQKIG